MKLKRSVTLSDCACIILATLIPFAAGCSFMTRHFGGEAQRAALRREASPGAREQKLEIPRASYRTRLEQGGDVNKFRLIQVFTGSEEASTTQPQWRVFDVRRGSVCEMLGLKNADVILAANGRMFVDPEKFVAYLSLLAAEKTASIQLKREGQELLMNYVFLDPAEAGEQNVP